MVAAIKLELANSELNEKSPREIIEWTVNQHRHTIVTTSFGPFSAVMLHLATRVQPDIPVVWVDTGYNTRETYLYAEKLIQDLKLNIRVFIPELTAARRSALMGGIPQPETGAVSTGTQRNAAGHLADGHSQGRNGFP